MNIIALQRNVIAAGQIVCKIKQRGELALKITIGHQAFGIAQLRVAIDRHPQRLVVDCLQAREVIVVDQHFRQRSDKFIPGSPGDRPLGGKLFSFSENFLDRDITVRSGCLPQALQIAQRIGQTVDMVDPQTVHHTRVNQFKDEAMRIVEYRVIFNPHAHQTGNLKETSPRKLFRRFPPGHQSPALCFMQFRKALILAERARVERILGVIVNQRGLFCDRVTF